MYAKRICVLSREAPGLIIAAPASGSGKTVVTLGILRALRRRDLRVNPAKLGPDYIDPAFHTIAAGCSSVNIDLWAMRSVRFTQEVRALSATSDIVLCEGVMGLFDGIGSRGLGSTADISALTGWPIIFIIDAAKQGTSLVALLSGFRSHRADIDIAGVILNKVGGSSHATLLRDAIAQHYPDFPVLGTIPRNPDLHLPSRHLGLIQATETQNLESFLEKAADQIDTALDIDQLLSLARPSHLPEVAAPEPPLPPLGQRIAVAMDAAFAFTYPQILAGWRKSGAEILPFSPLAGESVPTNVDAVFLPGGYPELHAPALTASSFLPSLRTAAARQAVIYGECGGYMILGRGIVDTKGHRHAMAGLLPLETSFAEQKRHLGYRQLSLTTSCILGSRGATFRGHEFHYTTILRESGANSLFTVTDGLENVLGPTGLIQGRIAGSFIHLIDHCEMPLGKDA
ncbi:MAG: cobyrinate a,c-diamide synthase [Alphaproteobacteria bacterium]